MKILGISAHYHDSAAALVVDGMPVCAVQEERLSRRKNDATFPIHAIEWCLEQGALDPAELDAVVFYERSMLKFDRILTSALRAFPRSWRSFPHAIKNTLGEKVWVRGIISSQLGVPRDKIWCTDHHASHAAAAQAGGMRRVGDADDRPWRAASGRHHGHHAVPRGPVSSFARAPVFDVHRLSRLQGQRRRVQGDGIVRVRAANHG